jgi:N-acetylglucosaminyldiphosphoundecaprenol N-acetyl-beta-D-mannosaminyltransferase
MDDARSASAIDVRVRIDEVAFDKVTMRETVSRIVAMARSRDRARHVCTGNLDHLVLLSHDAGFREAYEGADLVVADGAPIVWLSKLAAKDASGVLPERVAGSDLFWELTKASSETGIRIFFLGGAPGAAANAAAAAEKRYPGAKICGTYCPPFEKFDTDEEQRRIRNIVRAANPDVLLVAFGAPKQEKWIAANKDLLGVPVSIGVGGSFEMAAGLLKRAPKWVQQAGLEWFYRFAQQPGRLFQRYFVHDFPYLVGAAFRTAVTRVRGAQRLPA